MIFSSRLIWLGLGIFLFSVSALAAPQENCLDSSSLSYECYLSNVTQFCDRSPDLWRRENFLVSTLPATKYPPLTLAGFQASDEYLESLETSSREKGSAESYGFLPLQQAHEIYHRDMNALYSCAITSSRINITRTLLDTIGSRYTRSDSVITRSIEDRQSRLVRSLPSDCNATNTKNTTPLRLRLLDSATHQYCTYRYYLDYMQKNINKDFSRIQIDIDTYQKEKGEQKQNISDTNRFVALLDSRNREMNYEIVAAKRTYPIALTAFVEMERTYSAHILLEFIYDDYRTLRTNLRDFLNPISQLFYKVLNAQSANR